MKIGPEPIFGLDIDVVGDEIEKRQIEILGCGTIYVSDEAARSSG